MMRELVLLTLVSLIACVVGIVGYTNTQNALFLIPDFVGALSFGFFGIQAWMER